MGAVLIAVGKGDGAALYQVAERAPVMAWSNAFLSG